MRFAMCDFETQRFAISFRDFFCDFSAEPDVRVAIWNLRFEIAAVAISIFGDAKLLMNGRSFPRNGLLPFEAFHPKKAYKQKPGKMFGAVWNQDSGRFAFPGVRNPLI